MKYFITKYVLTVGIQEKNLNETSIPGLMTDADSQWGQTYHKGEYFPTRESAIRDAERRRDRKMVSLKKSLAKLEGLTFK